jgi:membrane associated rhomboid family serine protease
MNKKSQYFPLGDNNPSRGFPIVNWSIIIANVVVFIFTFSNLDEVISVFGFIPANFGILTLFTSMFLHAGIAHIAGNMWYLIIFGDNVEDAFGHTAYFVFYMLSGLAASVLHFLLNLGSTIPAVGASGAISGVLGAYLIFFPNAEVYVSGSYGRVGKVSAKLMLLLWFGFQLLSSMSTFMGEDEGIAFFAHIGGFIFGVVAAILWKTLNKNLDIGIY